ncbi:MAG: PCRF domain-containing protein, partial [Candidatus Lindowbacteria bacterium]|nr:PCRF domain-containing protein [Candidatus Lindowbacteria bacterium]
MTDKLLQRAKELQTEFDVLDSDLTSAASSSDLDKVKELSQRRSVLEKIVESGNKYAHFVEELADVEDLLSSEDDAEILEMAQEDKTRLNEEIEEAKEAFRRCLLPPDPHDNKNILIEIRAGTGGDEAGLFASDLFKMYSRYAEKIGLKVEIMNANTTGVGGLKEIVFSIEGQGTYSNFKYESGVHRVQRVPETEASGRIHTS